MKTYLSKMKQEWAELIESTSPEVLSLAAKIAREHAVPLSQTFYEIMLDDPEAEVFLTNEQVEKYLKPALAEWTENVLTCTQDNIDQMISVQQHVGEVHARIGIPVQLVEMGARTLKKLLFPLIQTMEYDCTDRDRVALCRFAVVSIDLAMEIMSRVFSFSDNSASREDENYRIFSLLENAEEEKERQSASLLSWENDLIYRIMVDTDMESVRPLSRADFGLWFNHKGRHYFSGLPETGYIAKQLQELDELVIRTQNTPKALARREQRVSLLLQVKSALLQISIFLKALFDEVSRHEVGMDVLTRLLNRRFLPTIFKREIAQANRNGTSLSVLIIDVDKFKQINDSYGHQIGDEILCKVSQVFYNNVRSSDYVFRYGGDEFLIVLTEASKHEVRQVAERIRAMVSKQTVMAPNGQRIVLSLSIGGAMFSGHPDYERLIQAADEALYRAKTLGRNRVEM
ncbi:diguanylate cyclase DosC [Leminorella grimontii]|uniref:Diguanylate cyclase DosC n=1 Tax=Leminorella grimontii TaxID=82981 RepID=A0AAV5N3F7_9GAMM|nr:diguanylate cyclase [Leminorella grimontii]KFC94524.1 putative heme-regulated two-component response regulator [Leminorella grimontii ATCC 33999 = DSM 5078]GKX56621.1 diguanylate cyclase DosC [Leminorella grimontii]VFS61780.1 Diguanylate cyclase DosC [Leminorella grimontii]